MLIPYDIFEESDSTKSGAGENVLNENPWGGFFINTSPWFICKKRPQMKLAFKNFFFSLYL
jgi:hypothetical protein